MSKPNQEVRFLHLVFLVGMALFLCSIALGIYHSTETRLSFPSVYDNYLEEGDRYFAHGDYGRAAEHYRIGSLINREDPTVFLRLGICLELTEQRAAAKLAYEQAHNLEVSARSQFRPEHPSRKKKKSS